MPMVQGRSLNLLASKHILLDCVDFADTRRHFHESVDLFNLFKLVTKEKILGFIKKKLVSTTNYKLILVLDP